MKFLIKAAGITLAVAAFSVPQIVTAQLIVEERSVASLSEEEIAAEFVHVCVMPYPDGPAIVAAQASSRFDYTEEAFTSGGAKANWSAEFGSLGYTIGLGGELRNYTPQCELIAYTSGSGDGNRLFSALERELIGHLGRENVTRINDSFSVTLSSNYQVAIQRVPVGSQQQVTLIATPADALSSVVDEGPQ